MESRLRSVGTGLTRAMLALCIALLGVVLLLGTAQGPEYRQAMLLALAGGALLWKGLPWLCRRLAGLGALRAWLVLTLLCLAVKGAWVALVQVPMEGDYATFWGYANSLAARPVIDGSRYIALFPHIFGYSSFLSWFRKLSWRFCVFCISANSFFSQSGLYPRRPVMMYLRLFRLHHDIPQPRKNFVERARAYSKSGSPSQSISRAWVLRRNQVSWRLA